LVGAGAPVGSSAHPSGLAAADLARSGFDITALLVAVAQGLRAVHATSPAGCPFDAGPGALMALARERLDRGLVDPAQFDLPYRRYSPAALLDLVERGRPADLDADALTVVHGDAGLDRVWLEAGLVTGWTSVGRAGIGDPYRDLATMAADLAQRVTPEALGPFIDSYGLDHPDVVRLDWHVMLDQLLR
jgi:aminoglycoside 3'-phosphotransferase-1